jgi:hypothetical protein
MPYNTNPMPSLIVSSSFLLEEKLQLSRVLATQSMKNKQQVRFGSLEIHEHAVQLGGATVPSSGAPLGVCWERQAYYEVLVEEYEAFKATPREGREMIRSRAQRLDVGESLSCV